jgi:hypothetical protein
MVSVEGISNKTAASSWVCGKAAGWSVDKWTLGNAVCLPFLLLRPPHHPCHLAD